MTPTLRPLGPRGLACSGQALRAPPVGALAALAVVALASGCSGDPEPTSRERAAVNASASMTASTSGGESLFDLPEMRQGRGHRERGADLMESGYKKRDAAQRDDEFKRAYKEFQEAQECYHEALVTAPERFEPVIQNEIDQVARYMRQIQRDRSAPKAE